MKSRLHYNRQLKMIQDRTKELDKKYPALANDNAILAFKLGYQTRIADEYEEHGVKI